MNFGDESADYYVTESFLRTRFCPERAVLDGIEDVGGEEVERTEEVGLVERTDEDTEAAFGAGESKGAEEVFLAGESGCAEAAGRSAPSWRQY